MSGLQWLLVLFAWGSVGVFVLGALYKAVKFSTMPLNLRWEIYPVPHEEAERRHYGGSYMEEVDWVKKPMHSALVPEILEMASEIFLLKRVREYNIFGLWPLSMAMHWGIYLFFGWLFLLLVETVLGIESIAPLTNIVGIVSFILGSIGCISLILKRASNSELSLYTEPVEYFNLLLLLSIFGTCIITWLTGSLDGARKYIDGIVFFRLAEVPPIVIVNFVLFSLFLIYMPFSKYLHYLAKYFNFHQSLWDDKFKEKGSAKDKKNIEQVGYQFKWAGPHVNPDKTWLENAVDIKLEEKK